MSLCLCICLTSLLNKYEISTKLTNLTPPKLNSEVIIALLKTSLTTGESHLEAQNHLGKGIIINKIPKNIKGVLLSHLLESSRGLTNLFHRVIVTRKNVILSHLKYMKELVEISKKY